jgi:hypothetical protein
MRVSIPDVEFYCETQISLQDVSCIDYVVLADKNNTEFDSAYCNLA